MGDEKGSWNRCWECSKSSAGCGGSDCAGWPKVTVEFTLAAIALNLTRIWRTAPMLRHHLRSETSSRGFNLAEDQQNTAPPLR